MADKLTTLLVLEFGKLLSMEAVPFGEPEIFCRRLVKDEVFFVSISVLSRFAEVDGGEDVSGASRLVPSLELSTNFLALTEAFQASFKKLTRSLMTGSFRVSLQIECFVIVPTSLPIPDSFTAAVVTGKLEMHLSKCRSMSTEPINESHC